MMTASTIRDERIENWIRIQITDLRGEREKGRLGGKVQGTRGVIFYDFFPWLPSIFFSIELVTTIDCSFFPGLKSCQMEVGGGGRVCISWAFFFFQLSNRRTQVDTLRRKTCSSVYLLARFGGFSSNHHHNHRWKKSI